MARLLTSLWFAASLLSSVYAEPQAVSVSDGFDLPGDVEETEVIRFVPIEASNTAEAQFSSSSLAANSAGSSAANSIASSANMVASSANAVSSSASVATSSPFVPISAISTEGTDPLQETAVKFEERKVPQDLDRPLRVGVLIGAKEAYLKYADDIIKITANGKSIKLSSKGQSMEMESREFGNEDGSCIAFAADTKSLQRACYPGTVLFRASNGKVDAINSVDVEDYLRGVIPYEIGKLDSGRIEALKAQAVAARTYAYKHYNSREAQGFDVYADTKDQVYKGLEGATPLTDAAVKATAGVTMMYNGEFIIAYYHSTCGGTTETLATWNRPNLPYLQSKPDRRNDGTPFCNESSYMKWERRFADKEIADLIKRNLTESKAKLSSVATKDFKKVKEITVKNKLKSGRIQTLVVKTDKGDIEVLTDRTRWLFKKNNSILPSSFFTIKQSGKEWILTGTGFGHGVGMCQMGVRARAQAGQSYQEILTHYYPGITLEKFDR
ncbi:MAG: SpoIID/LytB domain-containing protein [Fibrobacter sp.]|nr:SpoIID/LytB domain-containing protein [Fibrobacter sp.]MDO4947024.1 SpoIID/LytB domain-containing protein [Fibrobacter sp.]